MNNSNNNNTTPPISNPRSGTKSVNLMNNMYDQGQGSFNNVNENNHVSSHLQLQINTFWVLYKR